MKPRSKKNKGRKLQNLVAEKLSQFLNIPYGKDQLIESREMGQAGVDVKLIGEAKEKFPVAIECKNTENLRINEAIDQAIKNRDKYGYKYWAVVWKKNRHSPKIIMDLDEFLNLLSDFHK